MNRVSDRYIRLRESKKAIILLVIIFLNTLITGCETTKVTGEIAAPAINKTVEVVKPIASEADHRIAGALKALTNTTENTTAGE